jgi:uncharacterized glyoxalase superfamily protein PhnB
MAKNAKKLNKKAAKPAAKKAVKKAAAKPAKKQPAKKQSAKKLAAKKPVAKQAAAKKKTAKPATSAAPKGHALLSVSPGFTANDAAKSVAWYCDLLGFTVKERWEHEGQFQGAQVGSGNVLINIGQDDWKMGHDRIKGQGTRMYIMTGPDIDKYAAEIKARGGQLDQEPSDGWGMRVFAITDPDGFKLTFMAPAKK